MVFSRSLLNIGWSGNQPVVEGNQDWDAFSIIFFCFNNNNKKKIFFPFCSSCDDLRNNVFLYGMIVGDHAEEEDQQFFMNAQKEL